MVMVSRADLKAPLKPILMALANFASSDGRNCFPSIETVSQWTGYSQRSVQYALRELEEMGAITVSGNRLGGRARTTHYSIDLSWLQAAETKHRPKDQWEANDYVLLDLKNPVPN